MGPCNHHRLPCFTFVATGYCPYHSRCQFIHPRRLQARREVHIIRGGRNSQRNLKDTSDSFYWPTLAGPEGEYSVPEPGTRWIMRRGKKRPSPHVVQDAGVYSMWEDIKNFVEEKDKSVSRGRKGLCIFKQLRINSWVH